MTVVFVPARPTNSAIVIGWIGDSEEANLKLASFLDGADTDSGEVGRPGIATPRYRVDVTA